MYKIPNSILQYFFPPNILYQITAKLFLKQGYYKKKLSNDTVQHLFPFNFGM